ncbi:MAG: glycosyltransferase [Planctomycetia bacterium]|nr:glycosyltransferase [Planctomycetia bacterium]
MKLVHVVPHVDEEASGPAYSVPRLCQALAACGHEVELLCLAARAKIPGVKVTVLPQWRAFGRFAMSPALARELGRRAREADVAHNHSLWAMPNVAAGWVVPGRRAKLVTSPRGTLAPWALERSKWLKRGMWLVQKRALSRADLLHATSEQEFEGIRGAGLRVPVAIVPNGVDIPEGEAPPPPGDARTLLFLGRIHPVKGLDRLLDAWSRLEPGFPAWRLRVAGPGEAEHEREVRDRAARLGLKRVEFPGPVYGAGKSRAFRESDLFVLPSHTENFGQVVAEALAHGLPAVVSRGAPWKGLATEGCGWWVENTPESLARALGEAMTLGREELGERGRRGRDWMRREHAWDVIGRRMSEAYRWLTAGGGIPAFVRVD